MSEATRSATGDPWGMPLDRIDVSRAALFGDDSHGPYFARLRRDDPVHHCAASPTGPYWVPNNFIRGIADLPVRLHAR